ncbi:MAG: hypothetical protein ACREA0_11465 [bacterium]
MSIRVALTHDEVELVLSSLHKTLVEKCEAHAEIAAHPRWVGYTPEDFGIPQLEAIVARLEALVE